MIMRKIKNRYCLLQILVSMFLLIPSINVWAVKAYPLAVEVKQADGTTLMVVQHGDEDFHYCTTTDGILLVREGDSFFIAEQSGDLLMSSGVLAHESALRTTAERSAIARQDIAGFLQSSASIARKSRQRREPVVDTVICSPTKEVRVLLSSLLNSVIILFPWLIPNVLLNSIS